MFNCIDMQIWQVNREKGYWFNVAINLSVSSQVIDPYVKVDFHGIPADTSSFKTKVVKDNGKQQLILHFVIK